jgi:5-methylcytosine-specific restriction endonuclease McrA
MWDPDCETYLKIAADSPDLEGEELTPVKTSHLLLANQPQFQSLLLANQPQFQRLIWKCRYCAKTVDAPMKGSTSPGVRIGGESLSGRESVCSGPGTAVLAESQFQRRSITKVVQREVWRRDEGRCVECGSRENLEFDHIIPVSRGGGNTARNVQLLCEKCNRQKGHSEPGDF